MLVLRVFECYFKFIFPPGVQEKSGKRGATGKRVELQKGQGTLRQPVLPQQDEEQGKNKPIYYIQWHKNIQLHLE